MKRAKILSLLLTFAMLLSLVSIPAMAAEDTAKQPTETAETTSAPTASKTFEDVSDHWGKSSVERWAGYGVVNGDETGKFNPDAQMTRAEFATMLVNMMGYTAKAENTFGDVPADAWFADAVLKLAAAGVMKGDGANANPNAPISRQEAAVLLCRAFNIASSKDAKIDFADGANVADWAADAVAALTERGMIAGVGDNNFAPISNITRASVAKLADNMVAEYVVEGTKEITGEVKGLVIVAAKGEVTLKDATLSENLIVAPKAGAATVALTGKTVAKDIYVQGEVASVKVEKDASAAAVLVDAPKAAAEVAGKAESVMTTEAATEAAVTVAKGANVEKLSVTGENTKVVVSGTVNTLDVSATASDTDVVVNSGAKVDALTSSADNLNVSGKGTITKATVEAGKGVEFAKETKVSKVENNGDSAITVGGKPVEPGKDTSNSGSGGGGGGNGGSTDYRMDSVIGGDVSANVTLPESLAGKAEDMKLSYALDGKKIVASGSLAYIGEGMTDIFPEGEETGYYATVRIPVADADAEKALADDTAGVVATLGGSKTKDFIGKSGRAEGWAETDTERAIEKFIEGSKDGYYIDLLLRVDDKKTFTLKVDWDGSENSNAATTYSATTYTIDFTGVELLDKNVVKRAQTMTVRPGNDYQAAYTAAGVQMTNTDSDYTYTVDFAKTEELLGSEAADDVAKVALMTHENVPYYGVRFTTPAVDGVNFVELYINGELDESTKLDNAALTVDGQYINYFAIAKDLKALVNSTWDISLKWYKQATVEEKTENELLAVTTGTLSRDTKLTVTLKSGYDGAPADTSVKVSYGDHVTEIPEREGYTFAGWTLGDKAFDGVVTENITLTATWAVPSDVKTAAELKNALENTKAGATITVKANIGDEKNYGTYKVDKQVTIKGDGDVTVYGSFIVTADDVAFDGLTIQNKGDNAGGVDRNAINAYVKTMTVQNSKFISGNEFANGVMILPSAGNVNFKITDNTFTGYKNGLEGWATTAVLITCNYPMSSKDFFEAAADKNAATTNMTDIEDQAIIFGNEFIDCKNDYTRNTLGEPTVIHSTANSATDNFRLSSGVKGSKFYVTGDVTRGKEDTAVPAGVELIVAEGKTLTIGTGITLTVEGTATGTVVGKDATSKMIVGDDASVQSLEKGTYAWNGSKWVHYPIAPVVTFGEMPKVTAGVLAGEDKTGAIATFDPTDVPSVDVSLVKGSEKFSNVRFVLEITEGNKENLRVIAKDTEEAYWNILTAGWGAPNGFEIADATTTVYLQGSVAGTYKGTLKLVDVSEVSEDTVLASVELSVTVEAAQ